MTWQPKKPSSRLRKKTSPGAARPLRSLLTVLEEREEERKGESRFWWSCWLVELRRGHSVYLMKLRGFSWTNKGKKEINTYQDFEEEND